MTDADGDASADLEPADDRLELRQGPEGPLYVAYDEAEKGQKGPFLVAYASPAPAVPAGGGGVRDQERALLSLLGLVVGDVQRAFRALA